MHYSKSVLIFLLMAISLGLSAQLTEIEGDDSTVGLTIKKAGVAGVFVSQPNGLGIWVNNSVGGAGLFTTLATSTEPGIQILQQHPSKDYHDIRLSGSRIIGSLTDVLIDIDSDTNNNTEDPNFFGIIHGDKDDPVFLVDQDGGVRADGNLFAKRINVGSIDDSVADIEIGGANAIIKANSPSSNLQLESNGDITFEFGKSDGGNLSRFIIKDEDDRMAFPVDNEGDVRTHGVIVTSDRNKKENIATTYPKSILSKLVDMPIYTWNYKKRERQHIGPMAQDFLAAFNLGQDDTTISTIDADGISLAAIKGLYELMQEELATKSAEIIDLQERLEVLESKN